MHDIFRPGFPGLLEALYVQERILERMLPSVYDVFVGPLALTPSLNHFWANIRKNTVTDIPPEKALDRL